MKTSLVGMINGTISVGGGGGGGQHFGPNFVSLPESRICLGNAFLSHMGGGGGCMEEENTTLDMFEVIVYRKPQRGRGTFLGIKTRCLVGYKV